MQSAHRYTNESPNTIVLGMASIGFFGILTMTLTHLTGNPLVGIGSPVLFAITLVAIRDYIRRINPDALPAAMTLGGILVLLSLGASAILSAEIMPLINATTALSGVATAHLILTDEEWRDDPLPGIVAGVILSLGFMACWTIAAAVFGGGVVVWR